MSEEIRKTEEHVPVREAQSGQVQKAPTRWVSPFEEMERLMDEFFPRGWLRRWGWEMPTWPELTRRFEMRVPKVDIIDRAEEVVVRAELPGIDKKDLEVTVTGDTLTLKGQTRHEEKEEKGDYFRSEITRGSFARTLVLPAAVDATKAKASFKDGLLEVTLPKKEEARRQSIAIE
ncbi:MAG: Hsp20/alpha crystallin family protein [Thiobacillaceae bacterium]|nr:Hsp20/alpha crystallin family protein [Thiobacillaceae bacterium]MDW8323787.1 Hsp20/alpha crystallin family protein [Burkholderiales bacterium]